MANVAVVSSLPPAAPATLAVANAALRGGFVLLPRTILHAPNLSRDAKLLYAVLLSYAWQQGSCFPGYERLMADLQCSINSVTKWMVELEQARLISRRRRGQGKTTLYTLLDPPPPPRVTPSSQTPTRCDSPPLGVRRRAGRDSVLPPAVNAVPQQLRPDYDSRELDSAQHQADEQVVVALLAAQGVTGRVAAELAATHPAEAIRQQVAWQRYRPAVQRNPAGALVQAIREQWPAPPAWAEARAREAAAARCQAEEAAARRLEEAARQQARATLSPEARVQGRLDCWIVSRRLKGHPPTTAEIAAQQALLIAQLQERPGIAHDSPR